LIPKLTYLKKKALSCELFYYWLQIAKDLPMTVRGHNLQKDYYICRQKLLGWDRTAEGVLCKLRAGPLKKGRKKISADHLLDKSFRMMYSNLGLSFRWTLPLSVMDTQKK